VAPTWHDDVYEQSFFSFFPISINFSMSEWMIKVWLRSLKELHRRKKKCIKILLKEGIVTIGNTRYRRLIEGGGPCFAFRSCKFYTIPSLFSIFFGWWYEKEDWEESTHFNTNTKWSWEVVIVFNRARDLNLQQVVKPLC
jgi:hypothetical protein